MPPILTHVRLLVNDYVACFRFYRDVLGFEVKWGDENSGYADFDTGSVQLALFVRQAMAEAIGTSGLPAAANVQDRAALILAVPDVNRAYLELAGRGVTFVAEPTDRPGWGIRTAHFRDPDGTLLEINEPLPE